MAATLLLLWLVLGIAAALLTLPGTVELLFLTVGGCLPGRHFGQPTARFAGRLAVVVPAHNEESAIGACVKSLLACPGDFSVVVVADNCSDHTEQEAQRAGARVLVRRDLTRRGKGYALDYAFTQLLAAGFDALIVVDADTTVSPNLVSDFHKGFAAGADALQCRYKVRNPAASARTRWMNVALMAFNVLRPRGRDRFGVSAGILGNGFALSRRALQLAPYTAVSLVEDLEYHLQLVRNGCKVHFVDGVTVFGEMPTGGRGVATQRSRWEGGRFRMIAELSPQLLREVLRGRLRLLEPLLELLLLPLSFHVALLLLALSTPEHAVRGYAAGALALVIIHLLAAVAVGGGGWRDASALFTAPFYMLWKLRMLPALLRNARQEAHWVRTDRE